MKKIERHNLAIGAEAFNAKYLEPAEIAHGFVYSNHFEQLAGDYHAVLIGPRGSGKTTLLKMLQPSALAAWKGPEADTFRATVTYSGVFIASDISWSKQLNALGYGKLSEENHRTLVLACFTTHVIHAVLETMASRANSSFEYKAVVLSDDQEASLAFKLAIVLRVKPEIPSLLAVRQALRNRLSDIRVIANSCSLLSHEQCSERLASLDYLHLDFLDVCSNICASFNEVVNEVGARWSLLFDELETAPDWIVDQLFSALRMSDPRLYLKLAISPVSGTAYRALFKHDGASLGHDYQQIRLWYSDRSDSKAFCRALWTSLTKKHGLEITAEEALGNSVFEPKDNRGARRRSPYSPGEQWHKVFTSLSKKDGSFSTFLKQKGIDLSASEDLWANKKDSVLRKAAPVAALRNFFLHETVKGDVDARKRKTLQIYAGAESIFAITEGNPRWFISLVSPLINYLVRSGERKVPNSEQAKEIDAAADRLIALLKTIPIERSGSGDDELPLDILLQEIGDKLHTELVENRFSIDPVQSFWVDDSISERTQALLASAVNRGAVMLVDDSSSKAIVGDMLNARLRLSFLLAAKYGLLLRKGKVVRLSGLITVPQSQAGKSDVSQLSFDID